MPGSGDRQVAVAVAVEVAGLQAVAKFFVRLGITAEQGAGQLPGGREAVALVVRREADWSS